MADDKKLRLNKHISLHLGVSRREADNMIANGKVRLNDELATLGARFSPKDVIFVNNIKLEATTEYQYIAFNKPVNYVCSKRQQGDSPTIYNILPEKLHRLNPVGRLDRNSSGLILLTNDGDFAYQMTHPSFMKVKIYQVKLDKDLQPLHQQMISDYGVKLIDGNSKLQLERVNDTDRKNWTVIMHEGRNRQIRRTFDSLDYTVKKLHRTNFGKYSIGDLKNGQYIEISK